MKDFGPFSTVCGSGCQGAANLSKGVPTSISRGFNRYKSAKMTIKSRNFKFLEDQDSLEKCSGSEGAQGSTKWPQGAQGGPLGAPRGPLIFTALFPFVGLRALWCVSDAAVR